MKKQGISILEIVIGAVISALLFIVIFRFWFSSNRMMEKTVKGFTINDLGRNIIMNIVTDIKSSAIILSPPLTGNSSEILELKIYKQDLSEDPENTPGDPFATIYYTTHKIVYTVSKDTRIKEHDFYLIKREVVDDTGTTIEVKTFGDELLKNYADKEIDENNIKKSWGITECIFKRGPFIEHENTNNILSPPPPPYLNNCGASAVEIVLKLKSFSREINNNSGYEVEYHTIIQHRGSAL